MFGWSLIDPITDLLNSVYKLSLPYLSIKVTIIIIIIPILAHSTCTLIGIMHHVLLKMNT